MVNTRSDLSDPQRQALSETLPIENASCHPCYSSQRSCTLSFCTKRSSSSSTGATLAENVTWTSQSSCNFVWTSRLLHTSSRRVPSRASTKAQFALTSSKKRTRKIMRRSRCQTRWPHFKRQLDRQARSAWRSKISLMQKTKTKRQPALKSSKSPRASLRAASLPGQQDRRAKTTNTSAAHRVKLTTSPRVDLPVLYQGKAQASRQEPPSVALPGSCQWNLRQDRSRLSSRATSVRLPSWRRSVKLRFFIWAFMAMPCSREAQAASSSLG
mmetsp:Transcript_78677/g.138760  ORF Transcript_78677/g.138760 Transcript_78677/m.138760 type:complete len:270 (+) Transcript_78677:1564-2373(+)